jgi:SIR2-like domain
VTGRTLEQFNDLIESLLYGGLRIDAGSLSIAKHLLNVLNSPIRAEKNRVIEVCDFFEHTYPNSSLLGVVRFLINAARANRKPHAIITFNADTLLETLIYLFLRRDHYRGPGPHGHPLYHYKSVNRPALIANHQHKEKTNIFHCHGTIMPKQAVPSRPKDSRDRLVFLEQEYLRIASTTASWPETLFLFHAQTTRMIFAGLSMSDANIRRWMSASETELSLDHELVFSGPRLNPKHFWVTRKPSNPELRRVKLVSMVHLGIRPAWIAEWAQLEAALSNMLAL